MRRSNCNVCRGNKNRSREKEKYFSCYTKRIVICFIDFIVKINIENIEKYRESDIKL